MPKYSAEIYKSGSPGIPVVVETDFLWNAEKLIKAQYPGYDIRFLGEITAAETRTDCAKTRSQPRAKSIKEAGLALVFVTAIYVCYAFYQDYSVHNAPIDDAAQIDQKHDALPSPKKSSEDSVIAVDIQSPITAETTPSASSTTGNDQDFPYRARLVDSRDVVVLQSGPGITSRNVAKLNTGDFISAESSEGKWIRVKSKDGFVGFVRHTQLEFASQQ